MFMYFEKETEIRGGAERERGRERIPNRLCAVSAGPSAGLDLTNPEIMT